MGGPGRRGALDQARRQACPPPEPGLDGPHLAPIPLVIVAQEMQQAVQGQHAELGPQGMPEGPGLAGSQTTSDGTIT